MNACKWSKVSPFSPKTGRLRRWLWLFVALFPLLLQPPTATHAQPPDQTSASYWQYSAAGRLQTIIPADVDHDGILEFLVADEDGKVDLLSASGTRQWRYLAQEPILSLATVNLDGEQQPEQEIVLAMRNRLVLLTANGIVIRQVRLTDRLVTGDDGQLREGETAVNPTTPLIPVQVTNYDMDNDGNEEILLLLDNGVLQIYSQIGLLLWEYRDPTLNNEGADPQLTKGDFDQDGEEELVLALFTPRRFGHLVYLDDENRRWELSVSGRVTALSLVAFAPNTPAYLAISTNLGHLYLYNAQRERIWLRTLNKPITAMTPLQLPQGPALAVGTAVGTVVAYNHDGQRLWTQHLDPDARRGIVALSGTAVVPKERQPALAVLIEPQPNNFGTTNLILLGSNRETIGRIEGVDAQGLTRLIDINQDHNSELLIARFATLDLLGISLNTGENAREWNYSLNAAPRSMLVVDFDKDGESELVVGTQDGRIHSLNNNGTIRSLNDPGGAITHLAALPISPAEPPHIVVIRNQANDIEPNTHQSWLEIRLANGEKRSETQFDTPITSLLVDDIHPNPGFEIIIGTQTGTVSVFSNSGSELWHHNIDGSGSIDNLLILDGDASHTAEIIIGTRHDLLAIRTIGNTTVTRRLASYDGVIKQIFTIPPSGSSELSPSLLIFVDDGNAYALNWRGILMAHLAWPASLNGTPTTIVPSDQFLTEAFLEGITAFLIATDSNNLLRLDIEDNHPLIAWQLPEQDAITSLSWNDSDGDALPDIAIVGNQRGQVHIYSRTHTREPKLIDELDLFSSLFALTVIQRSSSQNPDLLFVTENGLVQLYRAQENRPPLLTNPEVELAQGQYSISISVRDVENDPVRARLELQDPATGLWQAEEEKLLNDGNESLFWLVNPPVFDNGVRYRFYYTDGLYEGYVTPPPGPVPLALSPLANIARYGLVLLGLLGVAVFGLFVRQAQSPDARARRFLRQIHRQPQRSLRLLENRYIHYDGAPDFLLYLANVARQAGDHLIANLADGLFLLDSRPRAGLSIINSVLDEINELADPWQDIGRWQMIFKTGHDLIEAPTITELSLLRPQLVELLTILEERGEYTPVMESLLPILTNLRDSERVDLADDRLVYLNEAAVLLGRLRQHLTEFSARVERTLVRGLVHRWLGLVTSTIEELRGRAELRVTLKTRRLVPAEQTTVALTVQNNGRASAENIIAILDESPAYDVLSMPQMVSLLPAGHERQIEFVIAPTVSDRFRLSLGLTYDDRNQHDRVLAFADMVHLLPPVRDFKPMANPYMPGTPLRPNSSLFFGREELFSFIVENAGQRAHRNVLILVGQRRTGKTSALLRLADHVPPHLLPVYIDCQSLGVTPGMPALLHEFAWHIADALALQNIEVAVPEPAEWQEEPTRQFQRQFLPLVRSRLPSQTTLLLVFDEFEAFENLVEDGILPSTFFTYLRHLMQHSEGLNFIFVGTRRLEEMSADYWSVLFNIALYRKIDYLTAAAATRLICEPVAPNIVYDDLALDKILRVTAGHPYFLQLVCYTLVKRANGTKTGYVTISDVNEALDEMLRLGEVHFAYLWQRSSYVEKALLTAVSHLMEQQTAIHPEDLIAFLQPHGISLSPAEVTLALIQLVERDIMQELADDGKTRYKLRIELVGLWVAKNKSLTKLHASQAEAANGSETEPGRRRATTVPWAAINSTTAP